MDIRTVQTGPVNTPADVVVVAAYEGELTAPARQVDEATGGLLTRLMAAKEFAGKRYELTAVYPTHGPAGGVKATLALVVGLGKRGEVDRGITFRAAGAAAKSAAGKERGVVAFFLGDEISGPLAESAVAGSIVGGVGQDLYRAEKRLFPAKEILWSASVDDSLNSGRILGEAINLTRRLVNTPAEELYPATFADEAMRVAKECGMQADVWDQQKLEAERCGSLLAVAKGSSREPRLVMLRYRGGAKDAPVLALVGKGVTFDSGGLSIKPSEGMLTMKCDMAGAASVLGAMQAIAQLKLPINVNAYMGLVENMTGPAAFKLGDVLRARSGKTIEVHNTDAEGRLVLADVLDVALEDKVAKIIDLATLTGACLVALGMDVTGMMSNDQPWCDTVGAAAKSVGDMMWQLPMFPEYDELIKSDVADIKNVGYGRWGGAITAAKFLEQFVGDTPWTHLDIAGPAFREKPKPWGDAGASGEPVQTLVEVARGWK